MSEVARRDARVVAPRSGVTSAAGPRARRETIMTAVLTGGDPAKEAARASQDISRAMNAGS
ncbi:hypothetical protein AMK21_24990 [Streptomyces sp. CB00316]|nr:hypothetical protein AMK21_24990 [Streptomyces sp. CB00316]